MTGRAGLPARFWAYQRERFPLAGFVPIIAAFTFSSAAYSRLARGSSGFIPWSRFGVGALTALVFFFMLRVLDEHKDQDVDLRFRAELPVPRGLVSLGELRAIGGGGLAVVVALNAVLGLAYYLRAVGVLFGSGDAAPARRPPWPVAAAVAGATLIALVVGFAPQLVLAASAR